MSSTTSKHLQRSSPLAQVTVEGFCNNKTPSKVAIDREQQFAKQLEDW